jgi:hypothetical protein
MKKSDRNRRYGLWLLTCSGSLENKLIRREDKRGYDLPTPFQRAIGVRYSRGGSLRFPVSRGGYGGFGPCGPPRKIQGLLKGHFNRGPVPRRRMKLCGARQNLLGRSTGYAYLWALHIQYRSVLGSAIYVGSIYVRDSKV